MPEFPFSKDRLADDQRKKRGQEYLKRLEEIEKILELSEEEQRNYIEERLKSLTANSKAGEISPLIETIHRGFLGLDMKIRHSIFVSPFVVDDPDIYLLFFNVIRRFREMEGWRGKSLRDIIPFAVQVTLSEYFGNAVGDASTERQNLEFYGDASWEYDLISIKELKGKKIAICAEKAAVAQNLLAFVGLESELIVSNRCRIPEEDKYTAHMYIVIHGTDGYMIYDPTNPVLVSKEGKLQSYLPAIYTITEEQYQELIKGGSIRVAHKDYKMSENGQWIPVESNRIYAGPSVKIEQI